MLLVFLVHMRNFLVPEMTWAIYGSEAVAVFFVLSGYATSYVIENKERTWRQFLAARVARIYPVAVLAVVVTWIVDTIGWSCDHAYYVDLTARFFHRSTAGFDPMSAVRYLTFTDQLWFSHSIWGTNEPHWALGFLIPYYVLAGLAAYLSRGTRIFWIAVWCLVCGPWMVLYAPLWLVGVLCQWLASRRVVRSGWLAMGLVAGAWVLYREVVRAGLANGVTGIYLNTTVKVALANFFYFTAVGLMAGMSIVAVDCWCGEKKVFPGWVARAIRWAAGGSFTLYVVHQPLGILMSEFFRVGRDGLAWRVLGMVLVFAIAMGVAELGERRKRFYSRLTQKVIGGR